MINVGLARFPERTKRLRGRQGNIESHVIDQEIKRALHESMERAENILKTHQVELKLLADALIKYETLDAKEVKQLLETGSLDR